jgi:hypothetical protein
MSVINNPPSMSVIIKTDNVVLFLVAMHIRSPNTKKHKDIPKPPLKINEKRSRSSRGGNLKYTIIKPLLFSLNNSNNINTTA